jgi:hypothetical protein
LIVSRLMSIDQAQREMTKGVLLALDLGLHGPPDIDWLARVLRRTPGACPVYLNVRDAAGRRILLKTSDDFRVNAQALPTDEIELVLGQGGVRFSGLTNGSRNGG